MSVGKQRRSFRDMLGVETTLLLTAFVVTIGCTRASDDRRDDKQDKKPSSVKVVPILSNALGTDLTRFVPTSADHIGVMVRFDRIHNTPVGAATEGLLRTLPDHARVVGRTGTKGLDLFESAQWLRLRTQLQRTQLS